MGDARAEHEHGAGWRRADIARWWATDPTTIRSRSRDGAPTPSCPRGDARADARLALRDDQVALSTISVSLRPASSAVPVVDPTWAPSETVHDALTMTTRALSSIADVAIRFVLTVLPIALLLGAPAIVAVAVWRRVRGDRTPAPMAPASSAR